MPPHVPYCRPLLTPLVHFSAPVSPVCSKNFRGIKKMKIPGKNLILLLVFILTILSIVRLLKLAITTSHSPASSSLLSTLQNMCTSPSPSCSIVPTYSPGSPSSALTEKEFKLLSHLVTDKAPCNLLIFGLQPQYLKLSKINAQGITIFLEDDSNKINANKRKSNRTQIYKVEYQRPREVFMHRWDVILVDGPSGDMLEAPGRMTTIYTASILARNGNITDVVVHDIDRTIEKWFSWEFLCEENMVSSKGKLWNFRINGQSNSTTFCPSETIPTE